jgi:hypothetical protein
MSIVTKRRIKKMSFDKTGFLETASADRHSYKMARILIVHAAAGIPDYLNEERESYRMMGGQQPRSKMMHDSTWCWCWICTGVGARYALVLGLDMHWCWCWC